MSASRGAERDRVNAYKKYTANTEVMKGPDDHRLVLVHTSIIKDNFLKLI